MVRCARGGLPAFLIAISCLSGAANASTATGKINRVYVMGNGVAMFHLDHPPRTDLPACATGLPTRWAFNAATPEGQAKLSLVLTAYSSGREMVVHGLDACPDWGDTESVNFMYTL